MAASLSCAPGNIALNRFRKYPSLLSIQLKKSLWGYIATGELRRHARSTILEQKTYATRECIILVKEQKGLFLVAHFRFFSKPVSQVD